VRKQPVERRGHLGIRQNESIDPSKTWAWSCKVEVPGKTRCDRFCGCPQRNHDKKGVSSLIEIKLKLLNALYIMAASPSGL
jgi:hypothetical protein